MKSAKKSSRTMHSNPWTPCAPSSSRPSSISSETPSSFAPSPASPISSTHSDVEMVLATTIKARWVCEQAHQQMKEELGLDHFEGRSWQGLHRHALMTMIAYAFLQHRRLAT